MFRALLALPLIISSCAEDETISGYVPEGAEFVLEELDGQAFTARASIRFPEEGRVAGDAPCNGYTASQTVPLPWIAISDIAVTKRLCDDIAAETAYLNALPEMTLAEFTPPLLLLSNDDGRLMLFRAAGENQGR